MPGEDAGQARAEIGGCVEGIGGGQNLRGQRRREGSKRGPKATNNEVKADG